MKYKIAPKIGAIKTITIQSSLSFAPLKSLRTISIMAMIQNMETIKMAPNRNAAAAPAKKNSIF